MAGMNARISLIKTVDQFGFSYTDITLTATNMFEELRLLLHSIEEQLQQLTIICDTADIIVLCNPLSLYKYPTSFMFWWTERTPWRTR